MFHGFPDGGVAPGYEPDHLPLWHSIGRRYFGSIDYPEPSAGARADVKHPAAVFHFLNDHRNQIFDTWDDFFECSWHSPVLLVDIHQQIMDTHLFEAVVMRR